MSRITDFRWWVGSGPRAVRKQGTGEICTKDHFCTKVNNKIVQKNIKKKKPTKGIKGNMDSKKTLRRKYKMIKKVKELMGEKKTDQG